MIANASLDTLTYEFFQEFARCEYCLKAVGFLLLNKKDPVANWTAFAEEVQTALRAQELSSAVHYYLENPPRKQVLRNGVLDWDKILPNHVNQADLILSLICRVRNNLFHGGKFNGHWFEPQRSEELLRYGLIILRSVIAAHPKVHEAYAQSAV